MMKKKNIYTKHQAFNITYKTVKATKPEVELSGYDAASEYHHAPAKLKEKELQHYSAYFKWSVELYNASNLLINTLRTLYDKAADASSSFYLPNTEKRLNSILDELAQYQPDIQDFREDIGEFQICILITDIAEKQTQIQVLSDQLNYLSSLEEGIIETCNRKLYEVSSSRMSFYGLSVSIIALIVALLSIFLK